MHTSIQYNLYISGYNFVVNLCKFDPMIFFVVLWESRIRVQTPAN